MESYSIGNIQSNEVESWGIRTLSNLLLAKPSMVFQMIKKMQLGIKS